MLKSIRIYKLSSNKIINGLIVLYAAALPLGFAIANIILLIMLTFFIFYFIRNNGIHSINLIKDIHWIILFSVLFIAYTISLFYSDDIEVGFNQVYKKSSMFFLTAFVFVMRRKIKKSTINNALIIYSYSVTIVCVISILLAVYNCYDYKPNILLHCISDQNLASAFISYHKLYLSLYITIAIFFVLNSYFYTKNQLKIFSLKTVQLFVLYVTLILLGGRNSLVISTLFIIGYPLVYWLKNKMFLKLVLFYGLLMSVVFSCIYFNPILKEKIKESVNFENQYNINKRWGGATVRKLIWEYSYVVFKKNLSFGVGVGDTQKELNDSYLDCTDTTALHMKNYNTHNDMLQIAVTTGVFGLCLYLFSLSYIFYVSLKKHNYIHCFFIFLFLFSGLTESLLERDMGIRVYSFFSILLFIINNTSNHENSPNTQ